jgi:hypothetical protein
MQTIKSTIILISTGIALLFIASCSKDKDSTTPNNGAGILKEGIEAKIDSNSWKAFNYSAFLCGKQLTLTGLDTSLGTISITLNDTALAAYDLNIQSDNWATYIPHNSLSIYNTFSNPLDGGTVCLSNFNKDSMYISGSFIFYMYDILSKTEKVITQGAFSNISVTRETFPTSGLRAYVDGKLWTPSLCIGKIDDKKITILASDNRGQKLYLEICNTLAGTYVLDYNSCHYAKYTVSAADSIPYYSNSLKNLIGKVVISKISNDSLASGNFILSVYQPISKKYIQLTQGLFNGIKLQK